MMDKKRVLSIAKKIAYKLFSNRYILFESVPDMGDNTKAVFDEMVRRGVNKKYRLVWMLHKKNADYPAIKNVIYAESGDKRRKWYMLQAKGMICCNSFLSSDNPEQRQFFLTHGMYVKCPTSYYTLPKEIQYCLSSSEDMKDLQAKALNVDREKMIALGFPRNDVLTQKPVDLHRIFGCDYDKIVVWYPTFRQHTSGMGTGSKQSVPIIWDRDNAIRINEAAKKNRVLIVLKPHFAQDTSFISEMKFSNIRLIDDKFFGQNSITSYEFIAGCDAMLSDYSSVYFDYTLCDKPIGLVWEDYEAYAQNPGFALDMEYYMKGGEKIYTVEDFEEFIGAVAGGEDRLQNQRREIRDICNLSTDGRNSKRVTDFILRECGMEEYISE